MIAVAAVKSGEKLEGGKRSQSSVDFKEISDLSGQDCGSCKHFIRATPNRCQGVRNMPLPILAKSWCERFQRKS